MCVRVRLCSERWRCCGANLAYRERPLGWSVRLRPRGAHTSFLSGLYVSPRLLVTSNRSAAGSGSRQALSRRGDSVCATSGDRDRGPRSGRSLARGSPHQPSGNPDGTRSRGLVDQGAAPAAASAFSAPRAGETGSLRFRRGSLRILHARPGPRTKPAPGIVPSAPLVPVALPRVGASGGSTSQQCPLAVDALGRDQTRVA